MSKKKKTDKPFFSIRGGKCTICNKLVQNLNRHNTSNLHKSMLNKNNDNNFEYKDIITILKNQKKLIDQLISERSIVRKIFKSFKSELIDVINRCTDFTNSIVKYEKNIIFSNEIKSLSSFLEKATNNLFVLRSEKSDIDLLIEELEPIAEDKDERVVNLDKREEKIELQFKPNPQKSYSKIMDDIKIKNELVKKYGINRANKLQEVIKNFYKSIDNRRLFVVKNHLHVNMIENQIIKDILSQHDKNSIKNLSNKSLLKFCKKSFEIFYMEEAKQFENLQLPENTTINRRFLKQIIKKID